MLKTIFKISSLLAIMGLFVGCTQPMPVKPRAEYNGVDPKAYNLVREYLWLAQQNKILFDDSVTVGFKDINHGDVVGVCTFSPFFREIDLDIKYWEQTSSYTHLALLFHELTHCYCGRIHDYAKNEKYPETDIQRLKVAIEWKFSGGDRPGYWDDGCPKSLMYPSVVDDDCTKAHYEEYIKEMFDRCNPL